MYIKDNNLYTSREINQKLKCLAEAIDKKDLIFIVNIFNSILNECVSCLSKIFDDERSVRDIIYAALIKVGAIQQIKERETVKGRADLELLTSKTCLLIEFKRTSASRGPKASLRQAIEQIEKNHYGLLFDQSYAVYLVAMVISTEEKKILEDFCQEVC